MNRELADVPTREEERPHDERIRRERDPRRFHAVVTSEPNRGLVLERLEDLVAERRDEKALDQVGRQETAATVAEHDPVVTRLGHGTGTK